MPKHEPWHKPRKDEDEDDALLDWLGGGSKKPPAKKGGGCLRVALPVAVSIVVFLMGVLL